MTRLRTVRRPRHYVSRYWLTLLTPVFAYNYARDAYVLRGVGRRVGPVLRAERRIQREQPADGGDRRRTASWA
jgi:hypothetical protein